MLHLQNGGDRRETICDRARSSDDPESPWRTKEDRRHLIGTGGPKFSDPKP
jgi:hypothetical protein